MKRPFLLSGLLLSIGGAAAITQLGAGCGGTEVSVPVAAEAGKDATTIVDAAKPVEDVTTTPIMDAGVPDSAPPMKDAAPLRDAAGIRCGATTTCGTGEVCCISGTDGGLTSTCAASCADGGFTLACDGPEDCPDGGGNVCCATLTNGAGTPPNCPPTSVSATCGATCTTDISEAQMCPNKITVRLCNAPADCAGETQHTSCCTRGQGDQSATFCLSPTIAGFIGAKCL